VPTDATALKPAAAQNKQIHSTATDGDEEECANDGAGDDAGIDSACSARGRKRRARGNDG
jgi:hypothetical protein